MIVLVCGGRNFSDRKYLFQILDSINIRYGIETVIHGGAAGADTLGGRWAIERDIDVRVYKADWKTHGKAAGIIRNQRMLDDEKIDMVVAFLGGNGTQDMISRADKKGIKIMDYGNRLELKTEQLLSTGLFKINSAYKPEGNNSRSLTLINTDYRLWITKSTSVWHLDGTYDRFKFEELLSLLPKEISEKLIFNIDLFI